MKKYLLMFVLVLAGEMVFSLPFHTTRYFRPTFLEVFGFTNTQLGDVFAAYGVTAMLAYFPGGAIADKFSPRLLMTLSLFATAAGGLYMATFPGQLQLTLLYGFWGVTSILFFWSALIRATRQWGGNQSQGSAFGILEGGRGLVAAAFAITAVAALGHYMPDAVETASPEQRQQGFRAVILIYSAITALAACFTWFILPSSKTGESLIKHSMLTGMWTVIRRPVVWAKAAVVVCAYCCYKGLDNYSLYAVQVLGMNEVEAARLTALAAYIRPVAALVAGLVADRFSSSKIISVSFFGLLASYVMLSYATPASWLNLIYASIVLSYVGVFALRAIYFALLQETQTPAHLTGATVGLVSLLGYTPDIFFGPITGRILDASPGLVGHQHYFMFLTGTTALGLLIAVTLYSRIKKSNG